MKQKEEIAYLGKTVQEQQDVIDQKRYEIFKQDIQYKDNSIKIIDQEKKLKEQTEEFFDNADRILQQGEVLRQITLQLEDVEKLIDDVTNEVYDKAVERITDEVVVSTRKDDIRLIESSKVWIQNPDRKASRKEKQYALDRLDGVIKKIESTISKTLTQMKKRLLKPENKKVMVQEIKKEVKPSILKSLEEKKAEIAKRDVERKKIIGHSLDNER